MPEPTRLTKDELVQLVEAFLDAYEGQLDSALAVHIRCREIGIAVEDANEASERAWKMYKIKHYGTTE